jgi:hypothetical protein
LARKQQFSNPARHLYHLLPEMAGSLFRNQEAPAYGLSHHMFYRQSALFIGYVKKRDDQSFQEFLLGIEDGDSLEEAFTDAYGQSLEGVWQQFVSEIRTMNTAESLPPGNN